MRITHHASWILILLVMLAGTLDAQPRFRGARGGGQGMPGGPGMGPGLDPAMVSFIREYFPERAAALESLRSSDPESFREKARALHMEVRRLMDLKENNPSLFDVHIEEIHLRPILRKQAKACRDATDDADRARKEAELRASLERAFDLRQQIKRGEVEELRERLQELETGLERRKDRRQELIDEQLEKLTRDDSDSDW